MHVSSRRWLLLGLVALALALFFGFDLDRALTLEALRAQRGALAATIAAHPLASAGAYFAAYVAVTALSLP
ncbi:MAG: TVP38/TMEM64 family protein, partial [Xanthomonadales bacterium PRO6]|nr:TVP38/TMEM64 family protein [Xanthomonadales bacterium PRO6]